MDRVTPLKAPFIALTNKAQSLIAPPYDIVSKQQAATYLNKHPNAILQVTRPDAIASQSEIQDPDNLYAKAKQTLQLLIKNNYHQLNEHCYLLYEIESSFGSQMGICCLSNPHHLKKHEHTRPAKVTDRIQLVKAINCQISPVILCSPPKQQLTSLFQSLLPSSQFLYHCHYQNEQHRLYLINDPANISKLTHALNTEPLYIADGHHRSQAQAELNLLDPEKYSAAILSVVFPGEALNILAYHRLLELDNVIELDKLLAHINRFFDCQPIRGGLLPTKPNTFGFYYDGNWYQLTEKNDPSSELAINRLHQTIIAPFFGIEDPREDKRIDFIGGLDLIARIEQTITAKNQCAFTIAATEIETLIEVSNKNEVMPPKSTYFEPKLLDGLFLQK